MTIDLDEFERLEREWLEAAHTNGRFDVEFLRRKYELALRNAAAPMIAELRALRAEVEGLKDAYWKGRAVMGFDNDGAERCDVVDVPAMILDDCAEMRVTLDESYAENDALSAQLATAREAIQATVDLLESSRKAHSKGSPEYDALFIRCEVGGALEEALKKTTKGGGL